MKKILFPTDFSAASQNAFDYACLFAKKIGATIDILNIYHLPAFEVANIPPEYISRLNKEQEEEVNEQLKSLVADADASVIGKTEGVYGMFIPNEIALYAKEGNYDLIIIGTKGEHSEVEKYLGSVTTQTMLQANCPVLAVPEFAKYAPVKKIAYATDFSQNEQHFVAKLKKIAAILHAHACFVHIEANEHLEDESIIQKVEAMDGFDDFHVVESTSVMEGIDVFMKDQNVDWLSLYIPRRRLWERLFHSSFTKQMTFHSHRPLLVFHE